MSHRRRQSPGGGAAAGRARARLVERAGAWERTHAEAVGTRGRQGARHHVPFGTRPDSAMHVMGESRSEQRRDRRRFRHPRCGRRRCLDLSAGR
jgi:hypothetical protein